MANYRSVSLSLWTDSKFDDDFTPEDKYFWLYLLTNPHTTMCGCYEVSKKQIERELGYNWDTIQRLLDRMEKKHKVIRYNSETKEILVLNWYKYNWSRSAKLLKALRGDAKRVKSDDFRTFVQEKIDSFSSGIRNQSDPDQKSDRVSIPYRYPIDTSDTDSDTGLNPDSASNSVSVAVSGDKAESKANTKPDSGSGKKEELRIATDECVDSARNYGINVTKSDVAKCGRWIRHFGGDDVNEGSEVVQMAIEKAAMNGARKFAYVHTVLDGWAQQGFKTPEDVLRSSSEKGVYPL